ncbi:YveK family protein [Streptomyces blattellae]|uniref:lipopolysaccharide biosynthesis protein n=1 Tax=Streptomyces blattellae TaxID=2569855 RepID=UPI0012B87381|nr:lipopolysaccharide biosynthesis protein [Streptomyces blattellae]
MTTDTSPQPVRRALRALVRAARLPARWLLPAGVLLGAAAGGLYGAVQTPQYTATGYVMAVPAKKQFVDSQAALGFAQAYGRVATQLAVLGYAQMWADVPVATLRKNVRSETSPDAPMVSISATSTRPAQAADMANAVTRSLTEHAGHAAGSTGIKLVSFSRALKPAQPSSASPALTTLVGAGAGCLMGGLALLVRPRQSTDAGDAAHASVPAPAHAGDAQEQLG